MNGTRFGGLSLKKNPKRKDAKTLKGVRNKQRETIRNSWKAMFDGFRKAGLDEKQIARMQRMPQGALREERYNHSVVLEAPDLSPRQRDLLEVAQLEPGFSEGLPNRPAIGRKRPGAWIPDVRRAIEIVQQQSIQRNFLQPEGPQLPTCRVVEARKTGAPPPHDRSQVHDR